MTNTHEARPLRDALVAAVNGNPVTADEAWALIHEWDALAEPRALVEQMREALRGLDDYWYPHMAGHAIGERTQGHIESAERWDEFCRDWRRLMDEYAAAAVPDPEEPS